MEPDSIDTSSIAITQPPTEMDPNSQARQIVSTQDSSITHPSSTDQAPESPPLTLALEALLGDLGSSEPVDGPFSIAKDSDLSIADHDVSTVEKQPIQKQIQPQVNAFQQAIDPTVQMKVDSIQDKKTRADANSTESSPTLDNPSSFPQDGPVVESKDISMEMDTREQETIGTEVEKKFVKSVSATSPTRTEFTIQVICPDPVQPTSQAGIQNFDGAKKTAEDSKQTVLQPCIENHSSAAESSDVLMSSNDAGGEEHPEWEADSSPIESSSDDSSDDTSSEDESEDGENSYKLLSPEEQARILMAGDGGSDDEGETKSKGVGGQLRTKNEVPEVIVTKPDVTITPAMPIVELGTVETIVENIALIKGKISGEYRVLESGSVLCLNDRSVVGAVAETLGRVQQPLYSIMFTNTASIQEAGLALGTKIFYSEQHATYVFTQALKSFKGSDASNLHDEEVGDEEMEFSDDEAEMNHKRRVKQKRSEKHGARLRDGGAGRGGGHASRNQQDNNNGTGVDYDENEDGPYRPLTRPAGLAFSIGHGEAPQEGAVVGGGPVRGQARGNGRSRGDRGRGRGDRGRGRGGFQGRGGSGGGYSQPQNRPGSSHHDSSAQKTNFQAPANNFNPPPQNAAPPFNLQQQYSTNPPQMPGWPQYPPAMPISQQPQPQPYQQQAFQQAYQNMQNMQNMQNLWSNQQTQLPAGTYFNPAFFGNNPNHPGNPPHGQQGQKGPNGSSGS